ncbi:TetR/AcrR family transcriptional regulator [Dehalogenimonas formicexedens]|nr:TetR/AcrR family transcriptional regulator [Dehalogenimonas formicexedens]
MDTKPKTIRSERLKYEERRYLILQAALDVFAEKGFQGAKTREIAKRAGVSETLIFRYFATKEELYRTGLKELMDQHPVADVLKEFIQKKDDEGLLMAVTRHIMSHGEEDPRFLRLAAFSALEKVSPGSEETDTGRLTVRLAQYIRQRTLDGDFIELNADIAAKSFVGSILMYILEKQTPFTGPRLKAGDEEVARTLVKLFLGGICK